MSNDLYWFTIKDFKNYETTINNIKYKKNSQNYEDGIIKEIFNNIGTQNKISCEFGFHSDEANSLSLMENDWKCIYFDANLKNIDKFNKMYGNKYHKCKAYHKKITKDNINELLRENNLVDNIDFLSIDIDGNDYYILDIINVCKPRCICIEYNATLGPDNSITIPYDAKRISPYSDYWGSSYSALVNLADRKEYNLVAVESGVNLFFVRKDIELNNLKIIENAWQPPKSSTYINNKPIHKDRLKEQYNKVINLEWETV